MRPRGWQSEPKIGKDRQRDRRESEETRWHDPYVRVSTGIMALSPNRTGPGARFWSELPGPANHLLIFPLD